MGVEMQDQGPITDEPEKKKRKIIVTEKESNASVKFDGNHFRKLIKGDHPLGALKQLLAVANSTDGSIISDYLNAGGSALEVILVIERLESKIYYQYQPIFSVLSLIITRCRDEHPRLIPNTEEACKRLLRHYNQAIHANLGPNSSQAQKKITLSMLTAMVLLSTQLAREVLSTLSLRELTINHLAKHPVKYDEDCTRGHFIRYVLAYFYHENTLLIRQLLDNRNLLQTIIHAGLTLDDSQLLIVFLTTLKEKIVDNSQITKTSKLKMFNTKIMMKLLETYTWTGPASQNKSKTKISDLAEDVLACVHQLLIQLCTNSKLGVVFVDPSLGLDQKNYNELVFSVIKSMDPYWNVPLVRELALKIVTACPDLVAPTLKHFGMQGFLKPEVTYSFVHTSEFAKQVVDSLSADRNLVLTATVDQLTHLTVRTVFNMNLLACVKEGLECDHPTLRLQAVRLLNAMFQTLERFLTSVKARLASSSKVFLEYQEKINDYITKNVSLEQQLMVAWSLGVGGDQSLLRAPTETEYYLPLVDLLLSYSQVFPVYLPPVFISRLQSTCLDSIDEQTKQLFDVKVIKFITMFRNVQPSQDEFASMLKTLLPLLASQEEARTVLKRLLTQTGHFEGVEAEVDLWVLNLARFPDCEDNLSLFLAVLNQVVTKPKQCMKMIEQSTVGNVISDSSEFNWEELIEVTKNPLKTLTPSQRMLPSSRMSILVPALIKTLNSKKIDATGSLKFVTHLLSDILFSQVDVGMFSQVIQQCHSPVVEPVKEYLANIDSHVMTKSLFGKHTPEYRMFKTLTADHFSDDCPLKMVGEEVSDTIVLLVRMVVFYAVRVDDQSMIERCKSILKALMARLTSDCPLQSVALKEVFRHPLVLRKFYPHQPPSSANLTPLVLQLVDVAASLNQAMLEPYRQRFLDSTLKVIKKKKKCKSSDIVKAFSTLISQEEVVAILNAIVESDTEIDQWADVAGSLLQAAVSLRCPLPGRVVTVLSRCDSLQGPLVTYLTTFTHLIDFLDIDYLTSSQEKLNELCSLRLKFDSEGTILKRLLKNNKKNPQVLFASMAAVGGKHSATSPSKPSSHLVRSVTEAVHSDDVPAWLSDFAEAIGTYVSQLADEAREEVLAALYSRPQWAEPHVTVVSHIHPTSGRVADFVTKTLRLLLSLTSSDSLTRAEPVCATLRKVLSEVDCDQVKDDWAQLRKSKEWAQWVRLSLRLGETADADNSFLLTTLSRLSHMIYAGDPPGARTLTEMFLSHSQFLTVMLGKPSSTKTALLELLLTLLKLDPSIMVSTHVPVLLSAYSASLSEADQLILQLLQLYEGHGIVLTEWKPFLWGESAASFYSVRSTIAPGLWNKQNFSQLTDLFEEHKVNATITNYPVNRDLKLGEKMDNRPDVYDPAFYLPMLVAMFAPSEVFYTYKTCQSGCLSLVLAALSSRHEDVRTVAYVALQRFHSHLISNTNNQDALWLHFLDAVRRGLCDGDAPVPRLGSVASVFLSRCVLALTAPTDPLFLPLAQFLLAKPRLDLRTVPELLPLFNSFSVQHHRVHQEWILSVLRDGMRDDEDFNICLNSMAFKIILDYFSSTLASEGVKAQILEVLGTALKLKSGRNLLVEGYSLYPWLSSVVKEPSLSPVLLTPLISVLANLLHKSSATQLAPLLVHLACHNQLTEPQLTSVLAALAPHPLSADTVKRLVDVVDNTVGQVFQHRVMLENGVKYVEKRADSCKDVRDYLTEIIVKSSEKESISDLMVLN